jgi:hypothetical protein
MADEYGIPFMKTRIESKEEAQSLSCVIYSLFYNGKFITNEIMNKSKFGKIWGKVKEYPS